MESYKEMYSKADKGKALKQLTPKYHAWEEDGKMIIGAFISKASVTSNLGGDPYNQYLFETDDGLIKFSMGKAADTEFADQFSPGLVYAVKFQGKERIKGGRQVNKFEVFEVGIASDITPEPEKSRKSGTADDQK